MVCGAVGNADDKAAQAFSDGGSIWSHPRLESPTDSGVRPIPRHRYQPAGDMDLDGKQWQASDETLLHDYFLHGLKVFKINVDGQVAASDVNGDGNCLAVEDLVFLQNILRGTAGEYLDLTPVRLAYVNNHDTLMIERAVGGLYMEVQGEAAPVLLSPVMSLEYAVDSGITHILVMSESGESAFGNILYVPGDWISLTASTPEGTRVVLYDEEQGNHDSIQ